MKQYPPEERRTIDELITLYDLEPTIRDVFVEGSTDVAVFTWFLNRNHVNNVTVYDIDCIDIPTDLLFERGLPDGRRSRVITLGLVLCDSLGNPTNQITCIADTDFDAILAKSYNCENLLFTDFTCLEMFLYNPKVLQKFFDLFLRDFPQSAESVLTTLSETLQEVFLVRVAKAVLDLNTSMTDFTKCCKVMGEAIVFDAPDLTKRFLHNGNNYAHKEAILTTIIEYRQQLDLDVRHQIHGHDFVSLLSWYLMKRRVPSNLCSDEVVSRGLYCCLEIEDVQEAPVFATLLRRLN